MLAVKPQLMADVCQQLQKQVDFSDKLVLSIAAGVQVARFYALLGNKLNLVRIMPNTPLSGGKRNEWPLRPPSRFQPQIVISPLN